MIFMQRSFPLAFASSILLWLFAAAGLLAQQGQAGQREVEGEVQGQASPTEEIQAETNNEDVEVVGGLETGKLEPGKREQGVKPELEETRASLQDDGRTILIQTLDISVKGLSNKKILSHRIGVRAGDRYGSLSELRQVLDIGFNDLLRSGYFEKEGGITYRLIEEAREGAEDGTAKEIDGRATGLRPLRLEAEFRDAWTIYPIPYPYYSTGTGYGVKGRLKWDNFLGLLGDVTFYTDVIEVQDGNYGWDFSGGVKSSTIKLSPIFGISGSLGVKRDARVDGANWEVNAGLGGSFGIRALEAFGIGMAYSISDSSSFTLGYSGNVTTHPYFSTNLRHSLSLNKERASSGESMRDGYSMSVGNSYSLDSDPEDLYRSRAFALEDIQLDFNLRLSRSYFDAINFKGRAGAGVSFDFTNGVFNDEGYNFDVSDYNRGKREDAVKGNFIAYLNMDLAILVFSDSLLGDILLELFFDLSWVNNASGFNLEDTSLGSGFELIWVFHSLKFRFGYGIDLHNPATYTIVIKTGFFF